MTGRTAEGKAITPFLSMTVPLTFYETFKFQMTEIWTERIIGQKLLPLSYLLIKI
jgi:hypothetical protein